jgi:hypothetical protein
MSRSRDPDYIARLIHERTYSHLERRTCTAAAPMPLAELALYRWSHPDAIMLERITAANAINLYRCPNCGLEFTAFPRSQ